MKAFKNVVYNVFTLLVAIILLVLWNFPMITLGAHPLIVVGGGILLMMALIIVEVWCKELYWYLIDLYRMRKAFKVLDKWDNDINSTTPVIEKAGTVRWAYE